MKLAQLTLTTCVLASAACNMRVEAMELGPEMRMDAALASSTPASGNASMCARTDSVVFSCPLGDGNKTVSMCAGGDVAGGHGRFYYAFGHPGSPELTYPSQDQASAAFNRTHLGFSGGTGGYAYTFTDNGYKYVVYSIAGERGQRDGGVIVQRTGQASAVAKMRCQAGKITETDDDQLIDTTLTWRSDRMIEASGLPTMH